MEKEQWRNVKDVALEALILFALNVGTSGIVTKSQEEKVSLQMYVKSVGKNANIKNLFHFGVLLITIGLPE